jgi:type IV pilus assembly protein PilV
MNSQLKSQSGFSMLEVLISMILIIIGVMGMAGIQLLAIKKTMGAQYQGVSAMLASDMVNKMQANIGYWGVSSPSTATAVNATITINGAAVSANNCNGAICTPAQMASFDLSTWGKNIANALPSGTGNIACQNATLPFRCTITVNWIVNTTGIFATGSLNIPYNYQTVVTLR